jgi:glutathione synthase/RimK-type ligase-like ATP-grasp enzyme
MPLIKTSKIAITLYRRGSRSARSLRSGLSQSLQKTVLSVRQDRVHLLKPTRVVINWGSSEPFVDIPYCRILNNPDNVRLASNKLFTFSQWRRFGVSCPEWTTDITEARDWASKKSTTVFCRTRLQSHSGDGIVISNSPNEIVDAPLYTKYIKKKKEFRVHVFDGKVIDVQEKRRSSDSPDSSFLIRNHANGFVFCRDDIIEPSDLRETGLNAVAALGLDFGAVDIVYNEHYDKCYALEVNSAPGLEGTTLQTYINTIKEYAYG